MDDNIDEQDYYFIHESFDMEEYVDFTNDMSVNEFIEEYK